jgi:hypothetical protein
MRKKANIGYSGYPVIHLTADDAREVKGMLHRGDRQHDIAAYFGCYPVEIHLIASGALYHYAPVGRKNLPPPGPYVYEDIRKDHKNLLHRVKDLLAVDKFEAAEALINTALESI